MLYRHRYSDADGWCAQFATHTILTTVLVHDTLCPPVQPVLTCVLPRAGNRVQLSPDDYIMGALQLYLDIINLFIYILRIINESRRD